MANFITTLFKLTSLTNYLFWEIYIKLALALIIYSNTVFITEDILNTIALQATDVNKIAKRNFLNFQALAIFNFTLLDNLLIYS